MQHRKNEHKTMVQIYKNNVSCVFSLSCWFRHDIIENEIDNEKSILALVRKMKT